MPIQGLPRDAKFLAQVADLGLWLTHCRHRQPQLGGGHLERPAAFPPAPAGRGKAGKREQPDQLPLEIGQGGEDAKDQLAGGGRGVDGRAVPG